MDDAALTGMTDDVIADIGVYLVAAATGLPMIGDLASVGPLIEHRLRVLYQLSWKIRACNPPSTVSWWLLEPYRIPPQ